MSAFNWSPKRCSTSRRLTRRRASRRRSGRRSPSGRVSPAVDGRLAGQEIEGQLVRLGLLAAAAPFEVEPAEVVLDFVARFELADLQRGDVARGVADAADQDRRIGQVLLIDQ